MVKPPTLQPKKPVKVKTTTVTVMTQQDRETTRLMRLQNMLDDMCFNKKTSDSNKIKSADLLLKCLSAYRESHEIYMVEPLIIYSDDGKELMKLTAQSKESKK